MTATTPVLPASWAQRSMWLLNQLAPAMSAYNVASATRIDGPLDVDRLRAAVDGVLARHEVLRTAVVADGDDLRQVIAPPGPAPFTVVDLTGAAADAWRGPAHDAAAAPFDLGRAPLLRATLLRLSAEAHVLVLACHHIACDAWSVGVLRREVSLGYAGTPVADPPVQYADYADWQRERLTYERHDRLAAYWRDTLAGAPPTLPLPTDHPRPAPPRFAGATRDVLLPPRLVDDLTRLGTSAGGTLFTALLGGIAALLSRYTGRHDLVLGTVVANRPRTELEPLIGYFANTVPLRVTVDPEAAFTGLLDHVREVCLGAYAHQELPFELVVDAAGTQRRPAHQPLVQAMVVLHNEELPPLELAGTTCRPVPTGHVGAKLDFTVHLHPEPDGLRATAEYDRDLFEPVTVDRLLENLRTLLGSAAAHPDRPVVRLPVLSPAERDTVLSRWNDTATAFPDHSTVHSLIEERVAASPDAVAVTDTDTRLTYAALDARANHVAHRLRGAGAGPGTVVAICAERCVDLVAGLLGILKTGAAYLPLDPDHPPGRLALMLADAAPVAVLAQPHLRRLLPGSGPPVLALADEGSADALPDRGGPADAAYVIYTSGSTGRPKGVVNTHRALCNRLHWMQRRYRLGADDVVLQKTPVGFDVSVWEFFWPLMAGARLTLARPGGHRDARYLRDLIVAEAVTTVHFVPSMYAGFLAEDGVEACRSLRRVVCSGEELPVELARRHHRRLGATLHNLYGPTEAAIDVSHWDCAPRALDGLARVPIGRPIDNIRLYVLDAAREPVPIGALGELYIGGVGLARGYLGRPELTAERFLPDPFSGPGARMYRTGDLARWRADGTLEYRGRLDDQVKVRGFRVEPGEVEAALGRLPGVRAATVVARPDPTGGNRLVGYVVAPGTTAADLRAALRADLPEHLVPSAIVHLDAIPVTRQGKVDRAALPEPATAPQAPFVAPAGPDQQRVAGIWARLLELDRVGADDDFFDVGGHSLLAARLAARLREAFGVDLPLSVVFERPTVRGQSEYLDVIRRVVRSAPGGADHDGQEVVTL